MSVVIWGSQGGFPEAQGILGTLKYNETEFNREM